MIKHIQKGFTLIEIIVTIVIVSIATTSLLGAYNAIIKSSSDPLLLQQSVSIAQSYLEEITLLSFQDPDGSDTESAGSVTNRAIFDDVDDYHQYDNTNQTVRDNQGVAITQLSNFSVSVSVAPDSTGLPAMLLNGANVKQITVTVFHPAIGPFELIGYKGDY